jgi:hypothetical protein
LLHFSHAASSPTVKISVWDATGGVVPSVCVFIRRFSLIQCNIDQQWKIGEFGLHV